MRPRTVLIVAVCMGLITSAMVYVYVSGLTGKPKEEKRVAVVVAKDNLSPRTVIRPGTVEIEEVPVSSVHPDAIITLAEAEGRIVRNPIVAGEQVLRTRLFDVGEQPGLTFSIPPGKRAVSVAVNEVIGVAGFVKPGDTVDILATFDKSMTGNDMTTTVLQGVEVLAIAQDTESESDKAKVATTVTLAVTLDEAERLTLAEERGTLRLALRPALYADDQLVSTVTPGDVLPYGGGESKAVTASVSRGSAERQVRKETRTVTYASTPPKSAEQKSPVEVEVIRGTQRETVTLQ